MELHVTLTDRFKNSLSIYKKEYKSIISDIQEGFKDKSFDIAFEHNYRVSDSGIARLIKLRLKNKSANKGKSGGFRLIYYINKSTQELVFLDIFSKIGKNGKEDLPDKEYLEMLREYQLNKDISEKITIESLQKNHSS
ncbi:hypothetical protein HXZ94_15590 [Empedobacter falsenii]|uniref:hypothetical protein n=1 Tax=Empedobacter falsenii TaxID=343874 RepID=UPI002578C84E|nr:hypothetical protein [Empedobacter falsenii]MDM1299918.1 hypothetical protein [Empedobacter falsenii]MDM1319711.1 hypothetical protein [Empedobacter falsenii]